MKKEVKIVRRSPEQVYDAWIEALRSGEYKQTDGQLYDDDVNSFCCLGVLCDLARKDGGKVNWNDPWKSIVQAEGGNLPFYVRQYIGMSDYQEQKLIKMNDSGTQSFKHIASYIERYIKPKALKDLREEAK